MAIINDGDRHGLEKPVAFGHEVAPEDVGMSRAGVQRIVDHFERLFLDGFHYGAQLVVLRYGRIVLDRTIGLARKNSTHSVEPSTPFMNFSVTKPLTAMCVHKLIEDGRIELDAPVAAYWPEFGCKGKKTATIRHVLLHQAGIPVQGIYTQIPFWWHWERVVDHVARTPAEYEPGTRTAYHYVNYGFILGEVVRRVTGQPIDDYMRTHLFVPLGMDNAYLGLPQAERGRAAEIYWGAPDQRNVVLLFRRARHALMPAASLNCPARDIAVFYQMMISGGRYAGYRFVRPETAAQATQVGWQGVDESLQAFLRWGYGFGVGGPKPADAPNADEYAMGRCSTLRTFGHTGQRSSIGWADWDQQLVVAFTCNTLCALEAARHRWQSLADAVWAALSRPKKVS